jgi:hypothetical protein
MMRVAYADLPVGLVACPFCREMFEEGEEPVCPMCGIELARIDKLPRPQHDVTEDGVPIEPDTEPLPLTYMGRGKGALIVLAVIGVLLFFRPWVAVSMPDEFTLSGFDLARRLPVGWPWGAAVSWVVLVPTVASRRTIRQLRGARVAALFLALMPAVTTGILLSRPPHSALVPIVFTWTWAFWAAMATSLVAAGVAVRLGGRVDDIAVARGSSAGQELH